MKADLHDAELDELDTLLGAAPDPLQPLDVVSMDGYLCAVAVQPRIVPTEEWLPRLLDSEGTRWPPASMDSTWFERVQALAVRRFEAIVRGLSEEGGFDPVVSQWSPDEEPHPDGNSHPDGEPHPEGDPYAEVAPASREIVHWASGFLYGCETFEALLDHPDDAVHVALSHILRHVPPVNDDDRRLIAELDAQHPLKDSPQAIDETVQAALTLWDLTVRDRMAVRTVRREGAKVGRNDPCPCGSGRKFKQCHGRS